MEIRDFRAKGLSSAAIEVLMQLFVTGPTWDGNIISKAGLGELFDAGIASRVNGWSYLTAEGIQVASEWDLSELRKWHDQRWYNKAACR